MSLVTSPQSRSPEGISPKSGGKFNDLLPLTSYLLILTSNVQRLRSKSLPLTTFPPHMKDRNDKNSLLVLINLVMYHVGEMGNNAATNLG